LAHSAVRRTGSVLSSVANTYGASFDKLEPIVAPRESFGTFRVLDKGHSHHREILVVRIPGAYSTAKSARGRLDAVHQALWTLFGSLAALELRPGASTSVALPLLAGTPGDDIRAFWV